MPINERQLVRRCLSGDRNAFGVLYDTHAGRIFSLLRRLTGESAEAEDLTQETFLAAYSALASWRGEGAFGTWLCGIAFRLYANAQRRRAQRETETLNEASDIVAPDTDLFVQMTRREMGQRIEAEIAALPLLCREAFILVKIEGLSYREAAGLIGLPIGTLQSRLWRAVRLLRAALAAYLDPEASLGRLGEQQHDAVQERL
jgi:RNA polymerase sigma-70 factor (ECF subfamily)